jgi:predicted dehydrogenase
MGSKGALVIDDLDKQEPLLRAGTFPESGGWSVDTTTPAKLHRGTEVSDYPSVPGNYTEFYLAVASAIRGDGVMPVSIQDALDVALIIDQAREISIR